MALKINDLILTDVWEIALFSLIDGKPIAMLKNCNEVSLNNSSTKTEITAGRGARVIATLNGQSKLDLNVSSATFDLNLLALQAGDKDGIYKTSAVVPVFEKIVIDDTGKATLKGTPLDDEDITVLLDNGTALIEGATASATEFSVVAKALTFDASLKGLTGTAFYKKTQGEAVEISLDSEAKINYVSLIAQATFQDSCSKLDYLGYVVMPYAGVDRNFLMQATKGGGESVQDCIFSAIGSCGHTELGKIYIYDENAV